MFSQRGRGGRGGGGRGRGGMEIPVRANNGGARSLGAQAGVQVQGQVRLSPPARGNSMPRGGMNNMGAGNNPLPATPTQPQQQPRNAALTRGENGRGRGRGRGRGNNNVAAVQPQQPAPGNSRSSEVPLRGRAPRRGAVIRLPRNPIQAPPPRQPSFAGSGVASRSPSPIEPVEPVAVGLQARGTDDPGTSTSIEHSPSPSPPPRRVPNRNAPENPNAGNETIPLDHDAPTPPITPRALAVRPTAGTPIGYRTRARARKSAGGNRGSGTGTGPMRIPPARAAKRRAEEPNVFNVDSPSIPRATFRRLVREVGDHYKRDLRWQEEAFDALQEAAEDYITNLFGMTAAIADNAGRSTIMEKDFSLAKNLQVFMGLHLDRVSNRDRGL